MQDDKVFKFKHGCGFFKWSVVSIQRNELLLIDYLTWLICIAFGWINWFIPQKKEKQNYFPKLKIIQPIK